MLSSVNALWLVYALNFVIIFTIVCLQKRNPIASMAWILCLMFFPVVGGIFFLIFGIGLKSYTRYKYQLKLEINEKIRLEQEKRVVHDLQSNKMPYSDMINYLLNQNCIFCENNSLRIFTDGKEKYDTLFEDIKNASESINILYFIIRNDIIGNQLIDLLTEKAKQGVKVRLLYDGLGSFFTPRRMFNRLRKISGSEVVEFFPVQVFSLSKINHRNHRKIVVVDDKIAYLGGMNIGDEYMSMSKHKNLPWRDTHIRIEGESAEYVQRCFAMDWEFSTGRKLPIRHLEPCEWKSITEGVGMQIVASGPDSISEEIKCGMLKMINSAKKYLYIQTPYFVPDQAFLTAIQMAAQSGVDVRIMIPGMPDKKYVYHTTMSYIGELLNCGVRVLLYPGFIHSKTMVVDDYLATIGSANMDIRSFQLLFELNAFIYDRNKSVECRNIFCTDATVCKELTVEDYKKRGIVKLIQEGFFRLFSPIM